MQPGTHPEFRTADKRLPRLRTSRGLPVRVWILGGGPSKGRHRDDAWRGKYPGLLGIVQLTFENAGEHEPNCVPASGRPYRVTS